VGEVEELEEDKMEFNLCTLLGIDVEAIAYRIAIGEDDNTLEKKATAVTSSDIIEVDTESQTNSQEANLYQNTIQLESLMDMRLPY